MTLRVKIRKRASGFVLILSTLFFVYSAQATSPGDLVEPPKELKTHLKPFLKLLIQKAGLDFTGPDSDPDLAEPKYDVNLYKITYWTTGITDLNLPRDQRKLVKATGMLLLPLRTQGKIPLVSYQHGTTASKKNVPSYPSYLETLLASATLGGNGFAVSAPDYLGLGDSDVPVHPYLHADSEATASADMILASENALDVLKKSPRNPKVTLSRQLFLSGYSQGGHATMALHRYLETEKPLKNFDIVAVTPMAGPFDLAESTYKWVFDAPRIHAPFYITFMLMGLNPVYNIFKNFTDVFNPEVSKAIEDTIANPPANGDPVLPIPATIEELLTPGFFEALKNNPASTPESAQFTNAFAKNSIYKWTPIAPVKFYHAQDDGDVPYSNSEVAYEYMKKAGADVELIPLGHGLDHIQGALVATPKALAWFNKLRVK